MSRASRFSVFGRKSTTTNPKEHRQKYLQPTIAQGLQIVLGGLKTGDILLYNTASRASCCSGEHDWTRAGLVIRVSEKLAERYAIDTPPTHSSTRLAVLEADPKTGKVELFPLICRLAKTIDTIQYLALRRRRGNELSANSIEKLESFALSALGRQFKPSLFTRLCCCCCGTSRREMFFISELIEDALQELGVLAKPQRALDEDHLLLSFFDSVNKNEAMSLDKLCTEGNSYTAEEMLISGTRNPGEFVNDLREEKRKLKEVEGGAPGRV